MANDRWYNPGDNYLIDDISGMKIRASSARMIPGGITGGAMVAPRTWEAQQPQDFVTGVEDDQTAAVVRPRQANQFTIVAGYVVEAAARGDTSIVVDDSSGFFVDDVIQIMLDNGNPFRTILSGINGLVFDLSSPLPGSVGTGIGSPPENAVVSFGPNSTV